jgi:hypothetical protein
MKWREYVGALPPRLINWGSFSANPYTLRLRCLVPMELGKFTARANKLERKRFNLIWNERGQKWCLVWHESKMVFFSYIWAKLKRDDARQHDMSMYTHAHAWVQSSTNLTTQLSIYLYIVLTYAARKVKIEFWFGCLQVQVPMYHGCF